MNYEKFGKPQGTGEDDKAPLNPGGRESPQIDVEGPHSPQYGHSVGDERMTTTPVGTPIRTIKENKLRRWKNFRTWKLSVGVLKPRALRKKTVVSNAAEEGAATTSTTLATEMEELRVPNPCLKGTCSFAQVFNFEEGDPVWLECGFKDEETGVKCHYCMHARCHGFPRMSMRVAKMAKGFRCPVHLI